MQNRRIWQKRELWCKVFRAPCMYGEGWHGTKNKVGILFDILLGFLHISCFSQFSQFLRIYSSVVFSLLISHVVRTRDINLWRYLTVHSLYSRSTAGCPLPNWTLKLTKRMHEIFLLHGGSWWPILKLRLAFQLISYFSNSLRRK